MGRPDMKELSLDARCLAQAMWKPNPFLKLSFGTPSKIHPRTAAALIELEATGLITKEVVKLAAAENWSYAATEAMREYNPKVSQKLLHSNAFPITKD